MSTKQPTDDLAALAQEAQQLETETAATATEGQGGPPPQAEEPKVSNAELIAGTLEMVRDGAAEVMGLHSPRVVLTDAKVQRLAFLWGKVCDKRGWDLAALMGDWKEEIFACVATLAVARELSAAMSAELAARRKPAEPTPAPTPDATTIDG